MLELSLLPCQLHSHAIVVSALSLTVEIQASCSGNTIKDFKAKMEEEDVKKKIATVRSEVEQFALTFSMPGHDDM